jgi:hypothetical protein
MKKFRILEKMTIFEKYFLLGFPSMMVDQYIQVIYLTVLYKPRVYREQGGSSTDFNIYILDTDQSQFNEVIWTRKSGQK